MFNKVVVGDIRQIKKKQFKSVNPKDYKKAIKDFEVPCEVVGVYQTKPFFDFDEKVVGEPDVDGKEMELKEEIKKILNLEDTTNIYTITRGVREKHEELCYSFHFSVDKMRISYYNNKKINTIFDKQVYAPNRGLHSIYTNKKLNAETKLIDVVPELLPRGDADITKYLVSYVEESFKDLDEIYGKITEPKPSKIVNIFKTFNEDTILVKELVNA